MSITIAYPKIIEFDDGTQLDLPEDTWQKRLLMIETNRTENEIRAIFRSEQFVEARFGQEFVKENQLGAGLIKKNNIWQIHVRFFQHGKHIAIDAEAELANDYGIEHLTHGWISAFKETWNVIAMNFGETWIYHKGVGKYVIKIIKEEIITLQDPKTKTDIKWICLGLMVGGLIGLGTGYYLATRNKGKKKKEKKKK